MVEARHTLAALRSVPRTLSRDAWALVAVVRTMKPLLALSDDAAVRGTHAHIDSSPMWRMSSLARARLSIIFNPIWVGTRRAWRDIGSA
jgi:hypothetical protein